MKLIRTRTLLLIISFLSLFSAEVLAKYLTENNIRKVVIIGAGPSGLRMADLMNNLGLDVTVLEKSTSVGGKCHSFIYEGEKGTDTIDLGAILVPPSYYQVMSYARQLGIGYHSNPPLKALLKSDMDQDHKIIPLKNHYIPSGHKKQVLREMGKLNKLANEFMEHDSFYYFGKDKKFEESFTHLCQQNGIELVDKWYDILVASFGYPALNDVPAMHVLNYVNSIYSFFFIIQNGLKMRMLEEGYQGLMKSIAQYLSTQNVKIKKGVNVKQIERTSEQVQVRYEQNGMLIDEEFDLIVIAASPKEVFPILDLDDEENFLLENQKNAPYRTVILETTNLPKGAFVLPEESRNRAPGQVTLIGNPYKNDIGLFYIVEDEQTIHRPWDETVELIREQMKDYGVDVGEIAQINGHKLKGTWNNYFPYYSKISTYEMIERKQGTNRTLYVGPAYGTFEIVERAMNHADHLIEKITDKNTIKKLNSNEYFKSSKNLMHWLF